jgi:putative ABC transport system ATP-binding protein
MGGGVLRVSDFSAGHGRVCLARTPDFTTQPGTATLLLGPSGIGKTTILLAIAGFARVFSGAATVEGWDKALKPAGFIFQDLHLIAGLTTLENVLLAPFAQGARQDKAAARALLTRLGLEAVMHAKAERLSRGQAQRAAIARALLMRPALLLADEPTASLDDQACAEVCTLLLTAAQETGAPLVIATHDARVKARITDHVTLEAAQ